MVGRLRNERLMVYGTRTSSGLRRLVCEANRTCNLWLDVTWEMSRDSDHYSFFTAGVPVMMLHTGLHEDYHRPSDDSPKVNHDGVERVTRFLFDAVSTLADELVQRRFRTQSQYESQSTRQSKEVALAAVPARLGARWKPEPSGGQPGILLESVVAGSAAQRAGLRAGERILRFAGEEVTQDNFASLVLAAVNPVEAVVQRAGNPEPAEVTVSLTGQPVRVGIAWRVDDAEPTLAQVVRVIPASPAAVAGVRVFDRVYEVNGQRFSSSDDLGKLLNSTEGPLQLVVETSGRLRTVEVTPLVPLKSPNSK
jgi:C-terminal processing protease CtpA/Prc